MQWPASHVDPEMLKLATQLVDRQTGKYYPADLEDRYETRLRALIDAKVQGDGRMIDSKPAVAESNVIDLMRALRKSLGEPIRSATEEKAPPAKGRSKRSSGEDVRRQPGLKLPIAGGGSKASSKTAKSEPTPAATETRARKKA